MLYEVITLILLIKLLKMLTVVSVEQRGDARRGVVDARGHARVGRVDRVHNGGRERRHAQRHPEAA